MEVTPPLGSDIFAEHDCYEALGERGIESREINIFSNTKDMNLQRGETEIIRENSKQMWIIWALLFPADVTCVLYEVEVLWQIWEYMKKICFKDVNEKNYIRAWNVQDVSKKYKTLFHILHQQSDALATLNHDNKKDHTEWQYHVE